MQKEYIEFKINRDFGDIITVYFDFIKQNIKSFSGFFIRYNGIFIIGLLISSYLLVSGFIGIVNDRVNSSNFFPGDDSSDMYLIVGSILFIIVFLVAAGLNYSLATSYIINYEREKGIQFEKNKVWTLIKSKAGNILFFIILLIPIYAVFFIVSIIFAFIPIIGMIPQYIVQCFILSWIGVSFAILFSEDKSVADSFGEGWNIVTKNFWKSIGVNFIMALLIMVLIGVVLMIPGIIVGLYTWHIVENDVEFATDVFTKIIYTIGMCSLLLTLTFSHCLSQFVNVVLYYTLHEKEYNTHTRNKIDQIGQLGE